MSRLLALDFGTSLGYAYVDYTEDHVPEKAIASFSGIWDLSSRRHEGAGMRFVRLRRYLEEMKPTMIVYEEVAARFKSTAAAMMYGGIRSVVTAFCEERKVPYAGIPVGTVKKRATGKGNANKEAMIQAAINFFGADQLDVVRAGKGDDDIADALWLCQLGIEDFLPGKDTA